MIYTCIVTHNRLNYSRRCIASYLATRTDTKLAIVDNASTDGTASWLKHCYPHEHILENEHNLYPGAACNQGWQLLTDLYGPANLYHRSDNDIEYLPGWQEEVEQAFSDTPALALLGLLNLHEDRKLNLDGAVGVEPVDAVGGNVFVPGRLYGVLRWDEAPWPSGEDGIMSEKAQPYGMVARLNRTVARNMAFGRYQDFPGYYDETARVRGIHDAAHSV